MSLHHWLIPSFILVHLITITNSLYYDMNPNLEKWCIENNVGDLYNDIVKYGIHDLEGLKNELVVYGDLSKIFFLHDDRERVEQALRRNAHSGSGAKVKHLHQGHQQRYPNSQSRNNKHSKSPPQLPLSPLSHPDLQSWCNKYLSGEPKAIGELNAANIYTVDDLLREYHRDGFEHNIKGGLNIKLESALAKYEAERNAHSGSGANVQHPHSGHQSHHHQPHQPQNKHHLHPPQKQNQHKPTKEQRDEVEKWLKKVGLEHYADNFLKEGYDDVSFIVEIKTISELQDIGITNQADQNKLLVAIQKEKQQGQNYFVNPPPSMQNQHQIQNRHQHHVQGRRNAMHNHLEGKQVPVHGKKKGQAHGRKATSEHADQPEGQPDTGGSQARYYYDDNDWIDSYDYNGYRHDEYSPENHFPFICLIILGATFGICCCGIILLILLGLAFIYQKSKHNEEIYNGSIV